MPNKTSTAQRVDPEPAPATPSHKRSEAREQELELLKQVLGRQKTIIDKISKRRFRMFLDSLPLLIVHVGTNQRVTFCNKNFSEFIGVGRQETTGKYLWEALPSGYDSMRPQLFEALQGREVIFEQSLSGAQERYFHITVTPDFGPGDAVNGVHVAFGHHRS